MAQCSIVVDVLPLALFEYLIHGGLALLVYKHKIFLFIFSCLTTIRLSQAVQKSLAKSYLYQLFKRQFLGKLGNVLIQYSFWLFNDYIKKVIIYKVYILLLHPLKQQLGHKMTTRQVIILIGLMKNTMHTFNDSIINIHMYLCIR